MRKLNLHELYMLGTRLAPLAGVKPDTKKRDVLFELWWARIALSEIILETAPLLEVAKRAARSLIAAITDVVPEDPEVAFKVEKDVEIGYECFEITSKLKEFESVLSNEMPSVPAFIVSKKGIYSTEDLISRADSYFSEAIRGDIPDQARKDICEAGRCLAYELPTACSFHLWRAVETTMCAYYSVLTKSTVEKDGISRNWAAYIKALAAVGAANSVTEFLDHIREEYRNPQTHPDQMVERDEALSLFGAAASSINQIVLAIQKVKKGAQQLSLISGQPAAAALAALASKSSA